jgi:hypothetical protein
VQAAAVEIFRRLAIEPISLVASFGDADELQKPGSIRVAVLAEPLHLLPEAIHRRLAGFVTVVRQIAIDVVHLGAPLPRLD